MLNYIWLLQVKNYFLKKIYLDIHTFSLGLEVTGFGVDIDTNNFSRNHRFRSRAKSFKMMEVQYTNTSDKLIGQAERM